MRHADQNSADNLMLLLTAAGCNYFMGVPCADDVMLSYQSTSFHDAAAMRRLFGLTPAPEFLAWLEARGIFRRGQLAACAADGTRCWSSAVSDAQRCGRYRMTAPTTINEHDHNAP